MIKVVIADGQPLLREGLRHVLAGTADMRLVGEAGDIGGAIALLALHTPDVLVLDLGMPAAGGLSALNEVRRRHPLQRIVVLSPDAQPQHADAAIADGADACVSKAMQAGALLDVIRKVATASDGSEGGGRVTLAMSASAAAPAFERLTTREREILTLIGAGLQVKQVAAALGISVSSVNTYRARLFSKMGLHSNAEVIRYAVKNGLVN